MRFVLLCALGFLLSCSEAKLLETPVKGPIEARELEHEADDEQVVPPSNISGVYLSGRVLKETFTTAGHEVQIGLVASWKGQRVTAMPSRFEVALSLSASTHPDVRAELLTPGDPEFDKVIRVEAPTREALEGACQELLVFTAVVDRVELESYAQSRTITSIIGPLASP